MARTPRKPKDKLVTREQLLRGTGAKPDDMPQAERDAALARAQAGTEGFLRQVERAQADIEAFQRVQADADQAVQRVQVQVQALEASRRAILERPFRTAIRIAVKAGDPELEARARKALATLRDGQEAEANFTLTFVLSFLADAGERAVQEAREAKRASYSKRGKLGAAARALKADPKTVRGRVAQVAKERKWWSANNVNKNVAAEFGISERTVRRYLKQGDGEK